MTSNFSTTAAIKTLTEPLLAWLSTTGHTIADNAHAEGRPNELSSSLCKLLCCLGDHSNAYIAKSIAQPPEKRTSTLRSGLAPSANAIARSQADAQVQEFLRCMLIYTGFAGYYGVDEEDSETTLGFWYLLQESLWEVVEGGEDEDEALEWAATVNAESNLAVRRAIRGLEGEAQMVEDEDDLMPKLVSGADDVDGLGSSVKVAKEPDMAQMLFKEVVNVLKRKVTWPTKSEMQESGGWDAGQ